MIGRNFQRSFKIGRGHWGRRWLQFELCEQRQVLAASSELLGLADLDLDGDLDVVRPGTWYENADGQGNLSIHHYATQAFDLAVAVDIDGDEDLDLVTTEPRWYENLNGKAKFSEPQVFPNLGLVSAVTSVQAEKLSDTGRLDVALITADEVLHYGQVDGELSLLERIPRPPLAVAADWDRDGDLDLSFIETEETEEGHSEYRVWIRQNDAGAYVNELLYSVVTIDYGAYPIGLDVRDINSDEHPDLIVHQFSPHGPDSWWDWHINQNGTIAAAPRTMMSYQDGYITNLFDADNDGDQDALGRDIAAASFAIWAKNDGSGNFSRVERLCSCSAPPIASGDLNHDGIADLLLDELRDGVPIWHDGATKSEHKNTPLTQQLQPGDTNGDFRFDAADLVMAAQGGKYGSDLDATWQEGNWTGGPGGDLRFNQQDLEVALATGLYERGLYVSSNGAAIHDLQPLTLKWGPHDYRLVYESTSGNVSIRTTASSLTSVHLTSESGQFQLFAGPLGPFDRATPSSVFRFDPAGSITLDLGPILPKDLPWTNVLDDLRISGSRAGGGTLGSLGFECIGCPVDLDTIQQAVLEGSVDLQFDLDGNRQIDFGDVRRLVQELLQSKFGDANRDGSFTSQDLVTVFQAGVYEDRIAENADWSSGDWNGDADFSSEDLVLAMQVGDYEGVSPKLFAEVQALASLPPHDAVDTIQSVDVDRDGDPDIVISIHDSRGVGGYVDWYENIGGELARRHVIESGTSLRMVRSADMDGDGDQDLLAITPTDEVIWLENRDGQGHFGPKRIINNSIRFALDVDTGDIDQDGDQDVLSVSVFDRQIVWYENLNGLGTFSAPQMIHQGSPGDHFGTAQTEDIDRDGDLDVVSTNGNRVNWHENDGYGRFVERNIGVASSFLSQPLTIADADGDGDLDVFTTAGSTLSWYANLDGRGVFGNETVITNDLKDAVNLSAVDFDNDGALDLLAGMLYGQFVWFEGSAIEPRFGPARSLVSNSSSGVAALVDLDQDGDQDLIATENRELVWHENRTTARV